MYMYKYRSRATQLETTCPMVGSVLNQTSLENSGDSIYKRQSNAKSADPFVAPSDILVCDSFIENCAATEKSM